MSKAKGQQKPVVPISLSNKKNANHKHDLLFTPYKIEWKKVDLAIPHKNNSTFFNSMKKELSNYKNDIDRLIKKENSKPDPKPSKNASSHIKATKIPVSPKRTNTPSKNSIPKGQNSERKHREDPKKLQIMEKQQCLSEQLVSEKLGRSSESDEVQEYKREIVVQSHLIMCLQKQNEELAADNEQNKKQSRSLQLEVENLKRFIAEESRSREAEKESEYNFEQITQENIDLKDHNSLLEEKIGDLSDKILILAEQYSQKQKMTSYQYQSIIFLKNQLQQKQQLITEAQQTELSLRSQLQNVIKSYQQKIQFMEQEKFGKVQALEKIVSGIRMEAEKEREKLEEDHVEEMNYYVGELKNKYEHSLHQLRQEKECLLLTIDELKQNQQNHKDPTVDAPDFKTLGKEFEEKINALVEENYQLKNKITQQTAEVESMHFQMTKYKSQVEMFEEREAEGHNFSQTELGRCIQEIKDLKEEREQITEQYEYKIMKMENQLDNLKKAGSSNQKSQSHKNFNKVLKEQLCENQELKEKLKKCMQDMAGMKQKLVEEQTKLEFLHKELELERMKNAIMEKDRIQISASCSSEDCQEISSEELKTGIQATKRTLEKLRRQIEQKNKQMRAKDEFIQKVLISRVGKEEGQSQMQFVLSVIKSLEKIE